MRKRVILLGSTGSIGQNTVEILSRYRDEFELVGISAFSNIEILKRQIESFGPAAVSVGDTAKYPLLKDDLRNGCRLYNGAEGITQMIHDLDADLVVNSIVGAAGLLPTLEAIRTRKNVALANKESLVVAGELVLAELRKHEVDLIPIDSEHSAIWQCLVGEEKQKIKKIVLTASGGPFLRRTADTYENITVEEALNHPNWNMGEKITIDSATLMNKGFEVIETHWLFGIPADKIGIVIHPQSVIHSMVEFIDGSIKAQLGMPDMKLPIQYALTYPERKPGTLDNKEIYKSIQLSFEQPDLEQFPCLKMAYQSLEAGGTAPAVLNAANEIAVRSFLQNDIRFSDIPSVIEGTLQEHTIISDPALGDYLEADSWARLTTERKVREYVT
ncbi:1-deoxy-D-xylulose-5-phosphate reductoisomerase [candidate division KSB1 bacterium]